MARQYADRLASILSQEGAQLSSVRDLLSAVEQDGSLETKQVVNHPLQRYSGRTAVHIAAANGMWECLELLLKNGGRERRLGGPALLTNSLGSSPLPGDPNAASSATDLCQVYPGTW